MVTAWRMGKTRSDLETARKMKMTTIVVSDEIREKYERAWKILGRKTLPLT